jgi:hypothetical protein
VKLQFKKRRLIPVALAILVLVVGSGVAYAYWTSGGSGNDTAGVGTNTPLTVAQTNLITGLVPGGSSAVDVTVTNPATFTQSFTQVVITVTGATGGCDITWFTGSTVTAAPNPSVLAANGGTEALVGSVSMTDLAGTNQNSCKNATLTLHFVVS